MHRKSRATSYKEPAARKPSGLAHLMTALHQQAAAVVTANTHMNGPDQVLPAESYTTNRRNGCVKIRREEHGLGSEEPISIPTMFRDISEAYPDTVALRIKREGQWINWTYEQYLADVEIVARAFIHLGLHRHHSVAILGHNSPEWVISDLAAIFAGGISVGLPTESTADDIARAALDAKADVVVVEGEAFLKKLLLVQHKLPDLKAVVQMRGEPPLSDKRRLHRTHKKHILSWEQLMEVGHDLPETRLEDRLKRVAVNHCCTLVYSSPPPGGQQQQHHPRGVMLSHDNLTWCSKMLLGFVRAPGFNRLPSPGEETMLSFLPMHAAVAAHAVDVFYCMSIAGTLCFQEGADGNSAADLMSDGELFFEALAETQPTVFFAPPAVYERIYHRLREARRSMSGLQRIFLDWSSSALREKHLRGRIPSQRNGSAGSSSGSSPNKLTQWQTSIAKNTVGKRQRESLGFGGRTVFLCHSKGGTLARPVLKFLAGFDMVVHESFGQPENCGLLTANIPKRYCKMATVGKAVPGVKTKVDASRGKASHLDVLSATEAGAGQTGEICAWGRNVFMGYLNKDAETKDALTEDGWLRLGDVGYADADGFLVAHGRPEEAITMRSGEVVLPHRIEQLVRVELPCARHVVVVGDQEDYLAVLITLQTRPDEFTGQPGTTLTEEAQRWFRHARFDMRTVSDVVEHMEDGIMHAVQAGVDRANQACASTAHLVHRWRVLAGQFSYQNGELTLDGRLRRDAIREIHRSCIQSLYDESMSSAAGAASSGSCTQEPDLAAAKHLRPPPSLLLQLSQIQEEDESKTSSRNSIDKAVPGGAAAAPVSPGTSVRVVDNSGAPSPAVSGRQVIIINKEDDEEDEDEDTEQGDTTVGEDESSTMQESGDSSSGNANTSSGSDDSAAASSSSSSGSKHSRISESFSSASSAAAGGDIGEVVKERITRK